MAQASKAEFHIDGLIETRAALVALDPLLAKELQRALKKAAEIVVNEARSRVPSKSGDAAMGIRATSSAGGVSGKPSASVRDSKSPPYLAWLDFGSRSPRTGNTRSQGPWSGSGAGPTGGRFLYPAINAKDPEIIDAIILAIEVAENRLGF